MEGRKRTVQVKFYVTEEERRLIREKMKLIPTRNMAAYLRKMAIDGYVVHIDTTDIRVQTAELQKIGVNVNQIARRLNSMGPLYTQDVADIKGALAQIWQLQRYILSSQRCNDRILTMVEGFHFVDGCCVSLPGFRMPFFSQ